MFRFFFFMPAYAELNSVMMKEGLDTLKDYVALKIIPYLIMCSFQSVCFPLFLRLDKIYSLNFSNIY